MTDAKPAVAVPPHETRMNKLEGQYALWLRRRRDRGEIESFEFEAIKLRLAPTTFYTPDFLVQLPNGELECHEVKGFWRDDARVKIKVAAAMHPFRFVAVTLDRNAGWVFENFTDKQDFAQGAKTTSSK
jgi:hypothetical protein